MGNCKMGREVDGKWGNVGGLTLEAACLTPIITLFLVAVLLSLYGRLAQFCWVDATHKVSQELRLSVQIASRGLEGVAGDQPLLQEFRSLPKTIQGMGVDGVTTLATGGWVLGRIRNWYNQKTGEDPVLRSLLKNPSVFLHWEAQKNLLWIVTKYETPMIWGNWRSRSQIPVPLWLDWPEEGEQDEEAEAGAEDTENFWSWGNWKRGKYLREKLGANLPERYPVLSYYENGVARMTKSMDLTAPTWQNAERLQMRLDSWAEQLLHFDGTKEPYGKNQIFISAGSIRERQLYLVIPENAPEGARRILTQWKAKWEARGIHIGWEERETSHRYEKKEKSPDPP